MDGARLSPFPHLSWLDFRVEARAARTTVVHMHGVVHSVSLTVAGRHAIRWISRGRETRWTEDPGAVHFLPADGEWHDFETNADPYFASQVILIPRRHLHECLVAEGLEPPIEATRILARDDAVLRSCMARLTSPVPAGDRNADSWKDEAARTLLVRLAALGGRGRPDWQADTGTFDRRTLGHLVERIDASLRLAPAVAELAVLVGLSPSHFAAKFRASTGLSLQRFVNRRRLRAALDVLRSNAAPLAGIALDLGFSSQSHFTRLFSDLTGMTPAKYRKQCAATLG